MARRYKLILSLSTIPLLLFVWYQYIQSQKWWAFPLYIDSTPFGASGEFGDKVIVMASQSHDDTSWVSRELQDWQRAIYLVDNTSAPLHTPINKGRESLAYLTHIIASYDSLPSVLVFLHSHEKSWHNDALGSSNPRALKSLRLDYVQENGYVNLRCSWQPGCKAAHRWNKHVTEQVWGEVFGGNMTGWTGQVGQACCAQFAVSKERVRMRPKEEYEGYRRWVLETELDDNKSGRVMEFLWHVVFGMDAVYCPAPEVCYCKVYGRCD